jgi:NADH dehydrogenase [ubiquinone] 1 alpha subcomplex assembly factor 6
VREEATDAVAYHAGIGLGLVTALRGSTVRLARGECSIPKELLPEFPYHKFNSNDPKAELTEDKYAILTEAIRHMAYVASSHLSTARDIQRDVPKHAKPCFLPVVPALHYLSKLEKSKYDIFDPVLLDPDRLTILALLSRTWLTGVF